MNRILFRTILNYLLECSPEYKLLNVNDYLK